MVQYAMCVYIMMIFYVHVLSVRSSDAVQFPVYFILHVLYISLPCRSIGNVYMFDHS